MRQLLLATNNDAKIKEYRQILAGLPFAITTLAEQGIDREVHEDGATFAANATLKAKAYAELSCLLAMADDSGLEVDALGGEPGVRSARYAGPNASDADRYNLLLQKMVGVRWEDRRARFRCAIAVAEPNGEVSVVEGTVEGYVAFSPEGANGFGYDPIFYLPERQQTMAQLTPAEKNRVSHRARAGEAVRVVLASLVS